jgi:hypothetical protein
MCAVTKDWARQRKAEERDSARRVNRHLRLLRSREVSIKDVVAEVMAEAYMNASANNTLPANARQVMYATRDGSFRARPTSRSTITTSARLCCPIISRTTPSLIGTLSTMPVAISASRTPEDQSNWGR